MRVNKYMAFNFKELIGKTARIRANTSGHRYGPVGTDIKLTEYIGSGCYLGQRLVDGYTGDLTKIRLEEFDIVENITGLFEEKGFFKLTPTWETLDEYGLDCVISLNDDLQTIHLSNGVKSLMNLKPGDKVNFALDEEKNKVYICLDSEDGYELSEGNDIKSVEVYRLLISIFDSRELQVNLYKFNNVDYPDTVFREITLYNYPQFIVPKKKEIIKAKKAEVVETPGVNSDDVFKYQSINTIPVDSGAFSYLKTLEETVFSKQEKEMAAAVYAERRKRKEPTELKIEIGKSDPNSEEGLYNESEF